VKSDSTLYVQGIPVDRIQPSSTNPRKHYDPAALDELAASIKAVGVQVPLSLRLKTTLSVNEVRSGVDYYEIVGGERRWRAAQIAGLDMVPAIARVMTDAECRESQLIENLQRADLTPMEEAECYGQMLDQPVILPLEVLAAKVGKTVQYVAQRLRLLQLIPEAREALRQGALNLTLALLIARLAPATQEKATQYAVDPQRRAQGKTLANRVEDIAHRAASEQPWERVHCATEWEMRAWIANNTLLPLKGVAWRLDDVDLIPNAGSCMECPKRAGNASMLFGDLAADDNTCTDPECYGRKQKAAMKETLKAGAGLVKLLSSESHLPLKEGASSLKRGQWMEAKQGSCPQVMQGVTEEGHRKTVCGDQKCKVHKHQVQQALAKGQSAGGWEAQNEARIAKQRVYVEAEEPIRLAVWAAIKPKLKGAKLLRAVIDDLADFGDRAQVVAGLRGIAHEEYEATEPLRKAITKAKDAELEGWLADLAAADALSIGAHMCDEVESDRADLWALGKLVGVDCDVIAKKVAPVPVKAKAAPAKKAAKPAKKKARKQLSAAGRKRIAEAMKKRWNAGAR
jgi:ParB family chromosome partitioning protein